MRLGNGIEEGLHVERSDGLLLLVLMGVWISRGSHERERERERDGVVRSEKKTRPFTEKRRREDLAVKKEWGLGRDQSLGENYGEKERGEMK